MLDNSIKEINVSMLLCFILKIYLLAYQGQESRVSSGPTWVWEPRHLGHLVLIFKHISKGQHWKWGGQDSKWIPEGMLALQIYLAYHNSSPETEEETEKKKSFICRFTPRSWARSKPWAYNSMQVSYMGGRVQFLGRIRMLLQACWYVAGSQVE